VRYLVIFVLLYTSSTFADDSKRAFGVSFLTPGVVNFVWKGSREFPAQLAVGLLDKHTYGLELGYSFFRTFENRFQGSLQVIGGHSSIKPEGGNEVKEWSYLGVSGTLFKGGFFIEPGLTFGTGAYSSPEVSLQIGWLWGWKSPDPQVRSHTELPVPQFLARH